MLFKSFLNKEYAVRPEYFLWQVGCSDWCAQLARYLSLLCMLCFLVCRLFSRELTGFKDYLQFHGLKGSVINVVSLLAYVE